MAMRSTIAFIALSAALLLLAAAAPLADEHGTPGGLLELDAFSPLLGGLIPTLDQEWRQYKQKFSKVYSEQLEEAYRRLVWQSNYLRVLRHNLLGLSEDRKFTLGENQFSDMTSSEFATTVLAKKKLHQLTQKLVRIRTEADSAAWHERQDPPAEVDWRLKACVSPVRDQGALGSAAIYGVVGSVEGQVCSHFGRQRDWLSNQQVIDCANATNSPADVYSYLASNKGRLDWEKPCKGDSGAQMHSMSVRTCSFDPNCVGAIVTGEAVVPSGDESALQLAVASGPVTVEVDASQPSFQLYSSGVYNEANCSSVSLDHVMLVVGYGVSAAGEPFWLAKNSWGVNWGEGGYIRMSRNKGNQCGIATAGSAAFAQPADKELGGPHH